MNSKSAFIVTKPLQYINCLNILDDNKKDLYIIDQFSDADNFIEKIKIHNGYYWENIFFFKTKELALLYVLLKKKNYYKIFLDSDFGIILRFLLSFLSNKLIAVYDEGFASYAKNLRNPTTLKHKLLLLIDKLQGGENWSGGCKNTSIIYLYHPRLFNNLVGNFNEKIIAPFKNIYSEHLLQIKELNEFFDDSSIFGELLNKDVIIYFSGYSIKLEYKKIIDSYPGFIKVLKPHPNIKNLNKSDFDYYIENNIPAELVVFRLEKIVNNLIIIHEGSYGLIDLPKSNKLIEHIMVSDDFYSYFKNFRKLLNECNENN
jgi:hypothetical protein